MTEAQAIDRERAAVLAGLSTALKNVSALQVDGGVLAQAWMPEGEELRLQTKGLPFSLIGSGDLLALFRCLSCKFSFSTDLRKFALMGSPGRVFSTGEAETSDNVQQCGVDIYLRNREARACRIYTTVHLPLFGDASRKRPVAVLEITQFKGSNSSYQAVFDWSRTYLQAAGIYLPHHIETQTFEMRSHAMSLRYAGAHGSAFGDLFQAKIDSAGVKSSPAVRPEEFTESVPDVSRESDRQDLQEGPTSLQQRHSRAQPLVRSSEETSEAEEDMMVIEHSRAGQAGAISPDEVPYGKSSLTKATLEAHFGYSLSEAAKRLGVSNTTVKRACRRYGIARWPRQEMMKAAAEKEAAASLLPSEAAKTGLPWVPDHVNPAGRRSKVNPARLTDNILHESLHLPVLSDYTDIPEVPESSSVAFPDSGLLLAAPPQQWDPLSAPSQLLRPTSISAGPQQQSDIVLPSRNEETGLQIGKEEVLGLEDISLESLAAIAEGGGASPSTPEWLSDWPMDTD